MGTRYLACVHVDFTNWWALIAMSQAVAGVARSQWVNAPLIN